LNNLAQILRIGRNNAVNIQGNHYRECGKIFYEVVEYIYEHHMLTEAENLSTALKDAPHKLASYPSRGAIEPRLANYRGRAYRYLVFNRTKRADIKIIFYVNEQAKEVYVMDIFQRKKTIPKSSEETHNPRHTTLRLMGAGKRHRNPRRSQVKRYAWTDGAACEPSARHGTWHFCIDIIGMP
jgi:hypothetical protein